MTAGSREANLTPVIARVASFFREELWSGDLERSRGWKRLGMSALRVAVHALGSFGRNLGSLRAAGLSLITLLALVPLLALVTAIARAFAYGEHMKAEITRWAAENLSPPLQDAVGRIQDLAEGANFRAIGVVGTLVLAYAAFELFTRVEQALDHVWKSPRRRQWFRRISDFTALVVIVPVLVLGALSFSSVVQGATLHGLREKYVFIRAVYEAGLGFVPHVLMWLGLAALYKAMPSTPVAWGAALLGGVVAGSGWVFLHSLYIKLQIGVVQFNAIYATFAALPLLIGYLQLTWTIVLLGAEVAYGVQNLHALRRTRVVPPVNHAIRRRLALLVWDEAVRNFRAGAGGCNLHAVAVRCDVPREWLDGVVRALAGAGLVARLADAEVVVPARPPEEITSLLVLRAIEGGEADVFLDQIPLGPDAERDLAALRAAEERALGRQ